MKKFLSRKLLVSIVGVVMGLSMAAGYWSAKDTETAIRIAEIVVGGVGSLGSVLGYIIAEAGIDKKAVPQQ